MLKQNNWSPKEQKSKEGTVRLGSTRRRGCYAKASDLKLFKRRRCTTSTATRALRSVHFWRQNAMLGEALKRVIINAKEGRTHHQTSCCLHQSRAGTRQESCSVFADSWSQTDPISANGSIIWVFTQISEGRADVALPADCTSCFSLPPRRYHGRSAPRWSR